MGCPPALDMLVYKYWPQETTQVPLFGKEGLGEIL